MKRGEKWVRIRRVRRYMMEEEGRGRPGREKERVKRVKGQRCYGRLQVEVISRVYGENLEEGLTGCARPTSLVR